MTTQTSDGAPWTRSAARPGGGGPVPPGGDRLPVPTRQRRPAFAALALVLILAGAAVSGLMVMRTGQKTGVLVWQRDLVSWQVFKTANFEVVQMSYPSDIKPVQEDQLSQLIG